MSRGHERHHERHRGLSSFGKDLVRRCSSHCELCDAQGVKLQIYEVPPIQGEPEIEHCIMICSTCFEQLDRPKQRDFNHWRCLNHSVWSQIPAVQVISLALLKRLSERERWAVELEEQVYLQPEIEHWLEEVELP